MDYLLLLRLVILAALCLAFIGEAFQDSVPQGLLALVVPGYVLYYAYVRSQRGGAMRGALVVAMLAVLLF